MTKRGDGQIRRSQVITTWGPGALIDLPRQAAIVGGLDTWPKTHDLGEIIDARLSKKLELMTGVTAPRLFAPPPCLRTLQIPSGASGRGGFRSGWWSRRSQRTVANARDA